MVDIKLQKNVGNIPKGGLISERFTLWLKLTKLPNLLYIVFRGVICLLFLEISEKFEYFLMLSHLYLVKYIVVICLPYVLAP